MRSRVEGGQFAGEHGLPVPSRPCTLAPYLDPHTTRTFSVTTSQSRHQAVPLNGLGDTASQMPDPPRRPAHAPPFPRLLALPAGLAISIAAFALLTTHAVLERSFVGAAGVLLIWCVALWISARRARRALTVTVVVRRQHWVQACAQAALIAYWAAHTPLVIAFLPFIAAQLVFAYAVDSLLSWSRRDVYTLGFGPFPIILSINLFLLFKPEWFFWQFVLIALGFVAKELIRWKRDERSAHIFNPSSFPLAVFSLVLLLTGTTDVTFGTVIANSIFDTPHIYLVIFLVALPGQFLFGVARTTLSAALTLYAVGLLYFAATGTYLFYDAYIPASVFIGMTLLVTDPSTSPRTELGQFVFGALYALATAVLFVLLERAGAPTFYDKLLPVPLLNLMVRGIDRVARAAPFAAVDPARLLRSVTAGRRYVMFTSVWVGSFTAMSLVHGIGDTHPGQYLPFWREACAAGSVRACTYGARLTAVYCERGSGWACNTVGILRRRLGQPAEREFRRACDLGFSPGCENVTRAAARADSLASAPPLVADLPIVLSGTKPPLRERDPAALYALACKQGWPAACGARTAVPQS